MTKMYDIQLFDTLGDDVTIYMYYRSRNVMVSRNNNEWVLKKDENYDFFTYFNSLSVEKWRRYTRIQDYYIILETKGIFDLYVFGHYQSANGIIKKEYISRQRIEAENKCEIIINIPRNIKSTVIGFAIYSHEESYLYRGYYAADTQNVAENNVNIALVTTTYKKEKYVKKNIELLNRDLFLIQPYDKHFCWYIIDNGQSLDHTMQNSHIRIISNPNVGGAGGFARGMMESISAGNHSHVLLMDDDVRVTVDSFRRLYLLLLYLRTEYEGYFVSGAMLKMEQPNVQHEDVGVFDIDGRHHPAKPTLDLNLWDSVVNNEMYWYKDDKHYYAGWWFCCIPSKYVREDNLPLPIFVRGDDVEYSLRNKAKFISLNGICIWHEEFEGKFSAAMEFYQVERNELIVNSVHDELKDVNVIGKIEQLFWEELYKFNYKGASLLLDSVEDFLKGPEYVFSLDGGRVMSDKKKLDNHPILLTEEIRSLIPYENIYNWKPVNGKLRKYIYDYSCNGQFRIPKSIGADKVGVIPYGWGYFQSKMCLVNTIYAVDLRNGTYCKYEKDKHQFKKLKVRHNHLMKQYHQEKEGISKRYKDAMQRETTIVAWNEKTHIN